ncbi:MAG: hypothetical protein IJJ33_07130 [Victivallales bacterium]|nr:hypothetical protein [Victivallales bacterium]
MGGSGAFLSSSGFRRSSKRAFGKKIGSDRKTASGSGCFGKSIQNRMHTQSEKPQNSIDNNESVIPGLLPTFITPHETEDDLIKEMQRNNVKFRHEEICFVVRDVTGQIVWLGDGSPNAGLQHINRHALDFETAFGIQKEQIPTFLKQILSKGKLEKVVYSETSDGHKQFTKKFRYNNCFLLITGIGDNGFIVTAFPHRDEIKE